MAKWHFDEVTLLITHYNRSESLARLLEALKIHHCSFAEIVVSDDASYSPHIERLSTLKKEYGFRLETCNKNRGLGNNLNKGQAAISTPFTLYIQEDFVPTKIFPSKFQDALAFLSERDDLDIVRFYSYLKYPYLNPYKNGYSEMIFNAWGLDYRKIYLYSDHPHLRRSSFTKKFGRYAEGIKGDKTEYKMCLSFIQNKGKGLFFDEYKTLFVQQNSASEPSTMDRSGWRNNNGFFTSLLRNVYRQIKYNWDIVFN